MKAIHYHRFGGSDVLALEEHDLGDIPDGCARVRVAGAGLNPVDAKLRSGALDGLFPLSFPVIPGWDVSGTVDSVGAGVPEAWLGARVFAYVRYDSVGQNGTCAQFCDVPAEWLARVPDNQDLVEAAAIPLVALTAHQSLVEEGGVGAGQSVLILAGSGAVGHYAIQIAKAAGASVTATASARHHDALRAKGADACIDYRDAQWAGTAKAAQPGGYDIILDAVGAETLEAAYDLLASNGTIIGLNDPPDEAKLPSGARGVRLFSRPDGTSLTAVSEQLASGALRPDDVEVFPMSEASTAHARLDAGSAVKLVLRP